MSRLIWRAINTSSLIACTMFTFSSATFFVSVLALFISSPFISDRRESQIAQVSFMSAPVVGISLLLGAISTQAALTYKQLEQKSEPTQEEVKLCSQCKYQGNELLVCAVHPLGRPDKNCKDWAKRES